MSLAGSTLSSLSACAPTEEAVLEALREVIDPELDESLVELGFVDGVDVHGGDVEVTLRLPTFWCAPNFAYLMAIDARTQALQVPGVARVRIVMKDHMSSDEISHGVSAGHSFSQTFADQTDGDDLDELRLIFRRKAFGMRQEQLVRFLLDAGLSPSEIVALRMADVLDTSDQSGLRLRVDGDDRVFRGGAPLMRRYLDRSARRTRLIATFDGQEIAADSLVEHLRRTRRERISMTFNAMMCRGLLETRYGVESNKKGDGL
jgi:metal-sulfur cluster biosynthetic enzyme